MKGRERGKKEDTCRVRKEGGEKGEGREEEGEREEVGVVRDEE